MANTPATVPTLRQFHDLAETCVQDGRLAVALQPELQPLLRQLDVLRGQALRALARALAQSGHDTEVLELVRRCFTAPLEQAVQDARGAHQQAPGSQEPAAAAAGAPPNGCSGEQRVMNNYNDTGNSELFVIAMNTQLRLHRYHDARRLLLLAIQSGCCAREEVVELVRRYTLAVLSHEGLLPGVEEVVMMAVRQYPGDPHLAGALTAALAGTQVRGQRRTCAHGRL